MPHTHCTLNLPRTGPLVITGANGSGKSSLCDALAWAWWGRTIRNEEALREGADEVEVEVETSTHWAQRKQGKKTNFVWGRKGEEGRQYVSATLATAEAVKELCDFSTWHRTHVFSSDDVRFFADSTDSERKLFLEQLLGVDAFQSPHTKAVADLRAAERELDAARLEVAKYTGMLDSHEEPGELEEPPSPDLNRLKELRQELRKVPSLRGEEREVSRVQTLLAQTKTWLSKMAEGTCPTCSQEIPHSLLHETEGKAAALRADLKSAEQALASAKKEVVRQREELDEELEELERAERRWRVYVEEVARREEVADKQEKARVKLEKAKASLGEVTAKVAHLQECAAALSAGGVRSWVVAKALSTISDLANSYLAMMATPIRVELTGYTELKKGDTNDKISLKIISAGGGKYRGSSQGERQRISLALRLAVSEIGGGKGTLWLDEPFSNMDAAGIDGCVELIRHLSAERCVVLITHDLRLAKAVGGRHEHLS